MQFYFIRHGQSLNNANWDRYGDGYPRVEDPELTEIGQQQAERIARFLSQENLGKQKTGSSNSGDQDFKNVNGYDFTHLYTSLMVRSVATGIAIAKAMNLPLVAWKDLHEVGGIFMANVETDEREGLPGRDRGYFERHYPGLILPDDLDHHGWWNRPFEEREERPVRARRFLDALLARHGDTEDRVAVVSHGGFYNYFLLAILGLSRQDGFWFMMNNAAITRIDFAEEVRLIYANRTDFLSGELIT
ncbi:MAG: histidine phosphatase family protein [Anaerolineae bacterium]|nr:histidine phosphatase family protein [Anaerolineae bacterium]